MAYSKVRLNGDTLMDVTTDTVASNNLLSGKTATGADGQKVNGGIASKTSSDLTASGATVTAPAGYYASNASKSVASGTAGTPTATKSAVSNHSVTVTPSVTNTAGYISGGTETGSAVSVSASELVSGTFTVDSSGTKDVTNYASASVPAGTEGTPTASKGSVSNHAITVTPSVTNTAGYISGGTKTGTGVSVTVAELESGTKSITENGTGISVSGYSAVDVDVAGSGGGGHKVIICNDGIESRFYARLSSESSTTQHYTAGEVLNFSEGDNLVIAATGSYSSSVYFNDVRQAFKNAEMSKATKSVELGNHDVIVVFNTMAAGATSANEVDGNIVCIEDLGALSTTATSGTDTTKTVTVEDVDSYGALLIETRAATANNNFHVATLSIIFLTASSSIDTKNGYVIATHGSNIRLNGSNAPIEYGQASSYGVYPHSCSFSSGNATISMYMRYSSTYTGTISGNYVTVVYGVKL